MKGKTIKALATAAALLMTSGAITGCSASNETPADAFEYTYDEELEGMVITNYLNEETEIVIPSKLEDKPVVGIKMDECDAKLTKVTMPDTVKEFSFSGVTKYNLTYINIPKSINNLDSLNDLQLYNYSALETIDVINTNDFFSSVDGVLFNNDKSIVVRYPAGRKETSYTIPDGVTEIGEQAFYNCPNLESIVIPDSVTVIGECAFLNGGLTSITIPDGVAEMREGVLSDCDNLISITLPDSVTEIGSSVFYSCESLTSITIPDSVTVIGRFAFEGCTSLASITIPDSVTKIDETTFKDCTSLTSATYKGKTYSYDNIDDLYAAINGN